MSEIIDSYSESNGSAALPTGFLYYLMGGQTFYVSENCILDHCEFYLKKNGAPTGNMCAVIFALTGTPGVDAVPTGSPIATSEAIAVSTLSDSTYALIHFDFAGAERINLSASTHYGVLIKAVDEQYEGYIETRIDGDSPTDDGNSFSTLDLTNWVVNCGMAYTVDVVFYVYGEVETTYHHVRVIHIDFPPDPLDDNYQKFKKPKELDFRALRILTLYAQGVPIAEIVAEMKWSVKQVFDHLRNFPAEYTEARRRRTEALRKSMQ